MKYKHYAPRADITIVKGSFEQFCAYVAGKDATILCFQGEESHFARAVTYGKAHDGASQAARLFDALRELDEHGAATVYARCPELDGMGLAVYNRLIRAAGISFGGFERYGTIKIGTQKGRERADAFSRFYR